MLPGDFSDQDLLLDDSFVRYICGTHPEDVARWEAYLQEHPEALPRVQEAWQLYFRLYESLKARDLADQLNRLKAAIPEAEPAVQESARIIRPWWQYLFRAAAVILIIAGITFIYRQWQRPGTSPAVMSYTTWNSEWGQRKSLHLPDGSLLTLNANTTVKISDSYGNGNREVYLVKGSVYFEVAGNSQYPFIVNTKGIQTRVLGTTFLIRSYDYTPQADVALLSGKVSVSNRQQPQQAVSLEPGEQVRWDTVRRRLATAAFDTVALHTWKTGRLVFDNTPAGQVIEQLEDWYGVPFEIKGSPEKKERFSGAFDNDELEKVLNVFCFTAGCTYKKQQGKVIIFF